MKILTWVGAIAIALLPVPAVAQAKVTYLPPVVSATVMGIGDPGGPASTISAANPLPVTDGLLAAATSTALTGTATTGTAIVGPFTPQLGRGIRITLRGTWAGTFAVGTSIDACTTISPLTIGGQAWGSFTGSANEIVDIPTLAGVVYCATATVSSGSLSYGIRQ